MPAVLKFKTTWGFDPTPGYENYKTWFPELKKLGYAGVEVNVLYLDDPVLLRQICDENDMEINALVLSAPANAAGLRPAGFTVRDHLRFYHEQLQRARTLKPYKVVAHSGSDSWTWEQSVEFYRGSLKVDEELGFVGKVCHETHRSRALFNPFVTGHVLKMVPELRITADFSHWVVVCERLLDLADEDNQLLDEILPHVHHIHSRVGTTQSSQCPDPSNPVFQQERASFESIWKRTIQAQLRVNGPDYIVTFVPEWGPYPYHPTGSVRNFSEVADVEGARHHIMFRDIL